MIKIYHIKRNGNKVDISGIRIKMSNSGSLSEVARTLTISIYCRNYKDIQLGEIIEFNNVEYHIFTKSIDSDGLQMDLTCFDKLIYIKKNQSSYNFKDKTAEDITRTICNDYNIKIGDIVSTNAPITRKYRSVDLYSIIQTAYTLSSQKTKDKYYMYYNDGLVVKKAYEERATSLVEGYNIMKVSHSESIENMINAVIVYDDKQNKIDEIKNDSWIELYGKLSISLEKSNDGENDYESELQDIERTLSVECLGDDTLITGKSVEITEKDTGIKGLFYIISDTHNYENGLYTTNLELSFEKVMDEQESGEKEEEKK